MHGENAVFNSLIADSLAVLCGTEPQIGGPDLNAEFAVEEDRGCGASAAKVEYPHSRSQLERGSEPAGHPAVLSVRPTTKETNKQEQECLTDRRLRQSQPSDSAVHKSFTNCLRCGDTVPTRVCLT